MCGSAASVAIWLSAFGGCSSDLIRAVDVAGSLMLSTFAIVSRELFEDCAWQMKLDAGTETVAMRFNRSCVVVRAVCV
jgi:hypothetical protein